MKNFDETRRTLRELGWVRCDRTDAGVHRELWLRPPSVPGEYVPIVSYVTACRQAGITPSGKVEPSHQSRARRRGTPKILQAKSIDTRAILQAVSEIQGSPYDASEPEFTRSWATIYDLWERLPWLKELPDRLVHAKMNGLISKGLLDGCPCGCRGDYEMTDKGGAFLRAHPKSA